MATSQEFQDWEKTLSQEDKNKIYMEYYKNLTEEECMCEYGKDDVNDNDDILLIECKKCSDENEEREWFAEELPMKKTDKIFIMSCKTQPLK